MAPEQALAESDVDHLADVWSIGVVLYECLSGVRPIEGESVGQVVMHLMNTGITPIDRLVDLPADVSAIIGRMLARERSRRPQDLREVRDVLVRFTEVRAPEFGAPRTRSRTEVALALERASETPSDDVASARDPRAVHRSSARKSTRAQKALVVVAAFAFAAMVAIALAVSGSSSPDAVPATAHEARPAPRAVAPAEVRATLEPTTTTVAATSEAAPHAETRETPSTTARTPRTSPPAPLSSTATTATTEPSAVAPLAGLAEDPPF
jgi:serine/threonine-protein kinase